MHESILKKLGFSPEETDIYIFLLKNPQKSISEISQNLGINRPKLYTILPSMEEMGLISKIIIGKRTFYIAENPDILHSYFNKIKDDFDLLVPEIKGIYHNSFHKPIFKHLKGKSGVRNIFLDIAHSLNHGEVFYRYSSRNNVEKSSIPRHEYEKYKKIREEKKLERMVITNAYLNTLKENKIDKEVVIIPEKYDIFEDNITKIIYANKVAIIDYNTEECFIIESQIFSNFERKIFKLLFKFLRQEKT